jgi:putative transferase (TIGR04331 family)
VEDGAKLATAQHGSSYGELEVSVHEKLEKNTSDIYITWGREFEPKEVPLPSKRLHVTREELSPRKDPSNGGILWASRAPRFFRAHGYTPKVGAQLNLGPPQRHIDGVLAFGSHLSPDVAAKTIFRLKPSRLMELEDFKEDVELKITSAIEKLSLDTGGRSFAEQARDVELVVVDHFPSTAFLECIALDFPVIAFNMIPMTRIREETRPHVNVLQRQRVVHEDPEDAAHLVNELMGGEERTVEDWWQKTERRRAVSTYRKMFARTSDDFVGEWAEFVDRVVCNKKK